MPTSIDTPELPIVQNGVRPSTQLGSRPIPDATWRGTHRLTSWTRQLAVSLRLAADPRKSDDDPRNGCRREEGSEGVLPTEPHGGLDSDEWREESCEAPSGEDSAVGRSQALWGNGVRGRRRDEYRQRAILSSQDEQRAERGRSVIDDREHRARGDECDSVQRQSERSPELVGDRWARLLARIYEVFPLLCSSCGGELRIIAFLTEPMPVHAILSHLGLPTRPPPLSAARAPPELAFDFDQRTPESLHDQTPAFDPSDPEPIPEFEFDQSPGV